MKRRRARRIASSMYAFASGSRPGGPIGRAAAIAVLLPVAFAFSVASPSLAAAGNTAFVGAKPLVEGIGYCRLEANGDQGGKLSQSALQYDAGGRGLADDGTIKKWFFVGAVGGNATVSLDIFAPGFLTHPVIEGQYASPYDDFSESTVTVTQNIPVTAGQAFGVTVSASTDADPQTEANAAFVQCIGGSVHSQTLLKIWEAPLTIGQQLVPNKEGPGEVQIGGSSFEYDQPVVESVSPASGPAAGGQEVTIRGKHLANAGVYFPEGAVKVAGQTSAGEDSEVKVITPEAVTSGPIEGSLRTPGPETTVKFKYTYTGTPRDRTPQIVLEPVTNITETSAQLNATVNVEGLAFNESGLPGCAFQYGVEFDDEGVGCEVFPAGFSEAAEPASTQLYELSPGTTYHYYLEVNTKYAARSGHAETEEASFKTLGIGEKSGEEKVKEAEKIKEAEKAKEAEKTPAKELSGTAPAPIDNITPTPFPITPPKGLVASIPVVGLLGGGSATATPAGVVPVEVSCPAGETSCIGSITLTSIGAVGASAHDAKAKKKPVLTLATGSFTVAGGKTATVQLHLSAKAKALLKRSHTLHASATIVAHDSSGATHTTVATITVRAAKPKHH